MDAGQEFLYRKERKGLKKRLKKDEEVRFVCPVQVDGRHGVLALTKNRILFVRKKGFGTKTLAIHRVDVKGVRQEKKRYGIVHVARQKAAPVAFAMTARGDASSFLQALRPKKPTPPPAKPKRVLKKSDAGTEPREPDQRRARIEELYRKGILSKSEYQWQIESL